MSQLQKRCILASFGAHGVLLLVVVIGSAFFVPKTQPISNEALRVIPSRLVDDALSGGGGNPNVPKPKEPEPPKEDPKPEPPKPVLPKPEPPKPKPEPLKEKPEPPKEKPKDPPKEAAPPKERRRVTLDDLKLQEKPKESRPKKSASDISKEIDRVRETLKLGLNKGTVVEQHGPGGEAYANYAAYVKMVYDNNWVLAEGVTDTGATARVEVVIDRDGDVIRARMVRPSGNSVLDQSVQRVLEKVKIVRPFPAGARERTRTFTIEFNVRNKLGAG